MKANKNLAGVVADLPAVDKHCWINASEAVIELGDSDLLYVEGWAVNDEGAVFEHGWIEYRGEVIEITPSWAEKKNAEYFPGVKYARNDIVNELEFPLVRKDGQFGMTSPEYIKASVDAHKYANSPLSDNLKKLYTQHFE